MTFPQGSAGYYSNPPVQPLQSNQAYLVWSGASGSARPQPGAKPKGRAALIVAIAVLAVLALVLSGLFVYIRMQARSIFANGLVTKVARVVIVPGDNGENGGLLRAAPYSIPVGNDALVTVLPGKNRDSFAISKAATGEPIKDSSKVVDLPPKTDLKAKSFPSCGKNQRYAVKGNALACAQYESPARPAQNQRGEVIVDQGKQKILAVPGIDNARRISSYDSDGRVTWSWSPRNPGSVVQQGDSFAVTSKGLDGSVSLEIAGAPTKTEEIAVAAPATKSGETPSYHNGAELEWTFDLREAFPKEPKVEFDAQNFNYYAYPDTFRTVLLAQGTLILRTAGGEPNDDSHPKLLGIDQNTGKLRWSLDGSYTCFVTQSQQKVVCSHYPKSSEENASPDKTQLLSLNPVTGKATEIGAPRQCGAFTANDEVIVCATPQVTAIDWQGKELWSNQSYDMFIVDGAEWGVLYSAGDTLFVFPNHDAFLSDYDEVLAVNMKTGQPVDLGIDFFSEVHYNIVLNPFSIGKKSLNTQKEEQYSVSYDSFSGKWALVKYVKSKQQSFLCLQNDAQRCEAKIPTGAAEFIITDNSGVDWLTIKDVENSQRHLVNLETGAAKTVNLPQGDLEWSSDRKLYNPLGNTTLLPKFENNQLQLTDIFSDKTVAQGDFQGWYIPIVSPNHLLAFQSEGINYSTTRLASYRPLAKPNPQLMNPDAATGQPSISERTAIRDFDFTNTTWAMTKGVKVKATDGDIYPTSQELSVMGYSDPSLVLEGLDGHPMWFIPTEYIAPHDLYPMWDDTVNHFAQPRVFGDLNGDGYEDAFVAVLYRESVDDVYFWTAWLWDPKTKTPRQLGGDPVAWNAGRCSSAAPSEIKVDNLGKITTEWHAYPEDELSTCPGPRSAVYTTEYIYDKTTDAIKQIRGKNRELPRGLPQSKEIL